MPSGVLHDMIVMGVYADALSDILDNEKRVVHKLMAVEL
jgi:hypothetical protein